MVDRFVDTSGWAEWADRSLVFHSQAVTCFEEVWKQNRRFVTTSYVLTELAALLTRPLKMPKSQQIQLIAGPSFFAGPLTERTSESRCLAN